MLNNPNFQRWYDILTQENGSLTGHQIPEVKIRIHASEIQFVIVVRGRGSSRQFKSIGRGERLSVHIQGLPAFSKEQNESLRFLRALWKLPVDVESVEPMVLQE